MTILYNGDPKTNATVSFKFDEVKIEDAKIDDWANDQLLLDSMAAISFDYHNRETEELLGIEYKYNEGDAMAKIREYINGTYGQHYVGNGDIQTVDFWESLGSLETTCRDTAIKYLARYGKKGGRNEKDLLKAVHYIILMMYAAPKENQVPKELKP
jgi:hypothetical protein